MEKEEEEEASPKQAAELNDVRQRADSGIVNPGRITKNILFKQMLVKYK